MRGRGLRVSMVFLTALSVLILSACGGGSTPAPAQPAKAEPKADAQPSGGATAQPAPAQPAPAQPAELKPMQLKVGLITCVDLCGWNMVGETKGLYAEQKLTVERIWNGSSTTLAKALIAGEVDVTEISPPELISAKAAGAKIKIIGVPYPGTPFSIFANKKKVNTVQDLASATIGTSQIGAAPYNMTVGILKKNNVPTDKVTWVNAGGNAERLQALLAGKLDAAALPGNMEDLIKGKPDFHIVARVSTHLPEYIRVAIAATEDAIKNKPEALQRYLIAQAKSLRIAVTDEEAYVAASLKYNNLTEKDRGQFDLAWQIADQFKMLDPNLTIDPAKLEFLQDMNLAIGSQKDKVVMGQLIDDRFQKEVIKQLGEFKR